MDASPDVLADSVRAKRSAIDNDLEVLRVRLSKADPRRLDARRWALSVLPIAAGVGAMWLWGRRRGSVRSLEALFIHDLANLYATEHELLPALDEMAARATDPELKQALDHHVVETEGQIERLNRVFRSVGKRPSTGASDATRSVLRESAPLLKRKTTPEVRDAWIIEVTQRLEHIEIANYGTARTYAELLGYSHAAQLLQQSLEEEREADQKLSRLAERYVNPRSLRAGG
jgi:ferritin-like metal-binding protein YciE